MMPELATRSLTRCFDSRFRSQTNPLDKKHTHGFSWWAVKGDGGSRRACEILWIRKVSSKNCGTMSTGAEYTCSCNHCSEHIQFPEEGIGAEVECPHCGRATLLSQPQRPTDTPTSARESEKQKRVAQSDQDSKAQYSTHHQPGPPLKTEKFVRHSGITVNQGWAIIFILVFGLFVFPLFHSVVDQVSPPQQWEYMLVSVPDPVFQDEVNDYGRRGWELVFARRASAFSGSDIFEYEMIFKRPKKMDAGPAQ